MTIAKRLLEAGLVVLLPAAALAQDTSVDFRLVAAPNNISGCIAADPQFTRVHTLTVKDGQATLTSPGGINTRLKLEKPNVYHGDYELGRLHLLLVVDLGAKTLTVTERNLGCRWTGKAE